MKRLVYTLLLPLLAWYGCRKDVVLKMPNYEQKVVVEASIETGSPATVFLSYSVPYFGEFDFTKPDSAFVKGAVVSITDGVKSETLTEADPAIGYFYYGLNLRGEVGKSYTLTVTLNGKSFSASTSIRQPVALDSLFFRGDTPKDSLGFIWQRFSEPAGAGNYYRWYAKRLGRDNFYAAPFNSVFDDKFVDGKQFEFGYDRGPQPNQLQQNREDPERGYYKRGDTVVVKFCHIGKREFDFWNTYYQNKLSNSNPFSSPANIASMFTDYREAFGAFVGYSPVFDTIVIPKN